MYKVATANEDMQAVLKFLRNKEYKSLGYILQDIDLTVDYSGTFDKAQVIDHLLYSKEFRMVGSEDAGDKTIVDNDMTVGRNCLTWIEQQVCFLEYVVSIPAIEVRNI